MTTFTSLETGTVEYGPDYLYRSASVPDVAGGILFFTWTRIKDPGPAPWSIGNLNTLNIFASNWYMQGIVGNGSNTNYNANSMLFCDRGSGSEYVGDFSYYDAACTEEAHKDWVWVAWKLIMSGSAIVLKQWLKFGTAGPVIPAGTTEYTLADWRTTVLEGFNGWSTVEANAWNPGPITEIQIGTGEGYFTKSGVLEMGSDPTLGELEALAVGTAPNTSAWADWPMDWVAGAPRTIDQSGNGEDLSIPAGGVLFAGPDLIFAGTTTPSTNMFMGANF